RGAGSDSGRAIRRAADCERAEGAGGQTSVPLFRQGQHGRRGQELRGAGAGLVVHGRLLDLASLGIRSRAVAAAAAESAARTEPVGVVVFHRPTQLASHPRVTDDLIEPPYAQQNRPPVMPLASFAPASLVRARRRRSSRFLYACRRIGSPRADRVGGATSP